MRVRPFAVVAAVCALCAPASAQPIHLTLADALARARAHAPEVLVAEARIEETRARLIGARVRQRESPVIDVSSGPRATAAGTSADLDVGFSQSFETGGQRAARIASAQAAIEGTIAGVSEARRQLLQNVAIAFFQAVAADQRVVLLANTEQTAGEVLRVAIRRFDAGDIPVLDVNLAKSALTRARSASMSAVATRDLLLARLARLTAIPRGTTITVGGALTDDRSAELPALLAAIERRPDILALQSSLVEAEADQRLGDASRQPDLGFTVRGKREAGDRAVLGGLILTWPAFANAQEVRAEGLARATRVRLELEAARTTAARDVEALHTAYLTRRASAVAFEQDALPSVAENEQLSQRSFEEGELSLADLLVVRREAVETRLEYLERLAEATETAIARDFAAGVLQ
jgi:cobalt-zinc-cadmium efflux system outer membrane protein